MDALCFARRGLSNGMVPCWLSMVSLAVCEGEVFGHWDQRAQTTTIKIICGLLRPDSGDVFLHNHLRDSANACWRG